MSKKKKKPPTGSNTNVSKDSKKLVSSIIEVTTKPALKSGGKVAQVASLQAYRKSISEMTKEVKKYALELCKDNLLSVKMSLMGAVREVEVMIRERREK